MRALAVVPAILAASLAFALAQDAKPKGDPKKGDDKKPDDKKDDAAKTDPDEDPNDVGALEKLALKVELEAYQDGKRFRDELSFEHLGDAFKELPRPKDVRFPSVRSSIEAEAEFTKQYYEQYPKIFDDVAKRARDVAKDLDLFKDAVKGDDGVLFAKAFLKKYPRPKRAQKGDKKKLEKDLATNEIRALLIRMLDRWEKLRDNAKRFSDAKTLEKELHAREEKARAFLKRYELGKGIATTRLDGSANLHVDLAKDTYEIVKKNINIINSKPLTDKAGKELQWRGKPLHGLTSLDLFGLKQALEDLSEHEYYVVQYAQKDGDMEKSLMRLTGARLLLGTYHVLETFDRVVVYTPAPPQ